MQLKTGRIIAAAVSAEILGILVLVVLVSIFGPPGFEAATPFAARLGAWVGPISGFVFCMLGGYWVARGAISSPLMNGVAVGIAGAVLDLVTGLLLGGQFSLLLLFSNAGRIVGAAIGGYLANPSKRVEGAK